MIDSGGSNTVDVISLSGCRLCVLWLWCWVGYWISMLPVCRHLKWLVSASCWGQNDSRVHMICTSPGLAHGISLGLQVRLFTQEGSTRSPKISRKGSYITTAISPICTLNEQPSLRANEAEGILSSSILVQPWATTAWIAYMAICDSTLPGVVKGLKAFAGTLLRPIAVQAEALMMNS